MKLAYLAGLFDGEGCVSAAVIGYRIPKVSIIVTNTNPLAIRCFVDRFGCGSVQCILHHTRFHNSKPYYRWSAYGSDAEGVLRAIRPYLILKAGQADKALAIREFAVGRGRRAGPVDVDKARMLAGEIRVLNRRGVAHTEQGAQ